MVYKSINRTFRPRGPSSAVTRSVYWFICHVKCSSIPRSWFRDVAMSLYSIRGTSLYRTASWVPMVSTTERFHCSYNSALHLTRYTCIHAPSFCTVCVVSFKQYWNTLLGTVGIGHMMCLPCDLWAHDMYLQVGTQVTSMQKWVIQLLRCICTHHVMCPTFAGC